MNYTNIKKEKKIKINIESLSPTNYKWTELYVVHFTKKRKIKSMMPRFIGAH